jgi:hypothetical protein
MHVLLLPLPQQLLHKKSRMLLTNLKAGLLSYLAHVARPWGLSVHLQSPKIATKERGYVQLPTAERLTPPPFIAWHRLTATVSIIRVALDWNENWLVKVQLAVCI